MSSSTQAQPSAEFVVTALLASSAFGGPAGGAGGVLPHLVRMALLVLGGGHLWTSALRATTDTTPDVRATPGQVGREGVRVGGRRAG